MVAMQLCLAFASVACGDCRSMYPPLHHCCVLDGGDTTSFSGTGDDGAAVHPAMTAACRTLHGRSAAEHSHTNSSPCACKGYSLLMLAAAAVADHFHACRDNCAYDVWCMQVL